MKDKPAGLFLKDKSGEYRVDSQPLAVYATDIEQRLKFFNSAAVEFTGLNPELNSEDWWYDWKLYNPDGTPLPYNKCPMAVFLREGTDVSGSEVIYERPDGERIWIKVYPSLLHDTQGKVVGGINILVDITEQKNTEKQLRQNQQKLRAITSSTPDFMYVFDLDHRFLFANKALISSWQYSGNDYVGKTMEEAGLDPKISAKHRREIDQVIATKQPIQGEQSYQHEHVGERFHEYILVPVLDAEGKVTAVAGTTRDITRRKQSEEKYRALFDTMNDGFFILKMIFDENDKPVNFQYLEVNPAFEKHTGVKGVEGKTAKDVVPDLEEEWFRRYGAVALTGKSVHFENHVAELNRWFDVFAFRIGKPGDHEVAVFFKNITEQKQAEEEREQLLRQIETERKRLSDIFQQAPSGMAVMRGPDHIFERVNDRYLELLGGRNVVGKTLLEAIPEAEEQGFIDLLNHVFQTGESFEGTDVEVKLFWHPDVTTPETRYIDFAYQPIYETDGSISGVFVQGIDQTERKQAQEELKKINETLEERVKKRTETLLSYQAQLRSLASQLSHAEENQRQQLASELHDNLGQLLALGKMKVDVLIKENHVDPSLKLVWDLNEILNDALRYTRELMTDLKPPPSIGGDIRTSIGWVAGKLEKHGLKVTIEDDEKPKPLDDEIRTTVIQSVRELLYNVIKHTAEKKAVIHLKSHKDQFQVTIKDEGKGFDYKEWELKPGKKGGFGLFNVLERIDLLGGHIEIDTKPGKGTKISLFVPLSEKITAEKELEKEEKKEKKAAITEEPSEELIKVLLVDDHRMVREGFRRIVEEEEDIVIAGEAASGEQAVKLARETSPDVILMDINMPGMDGIEATRRITEEMPDARVIGLSLHDEERVARNMRNAGASAYLTKSEAYESLIESIRAEASVSRR